MDRLELLDQCEVAVDALDAPVGREDRDQRVEPAERGPDRVRADAARRTARHVDRVVGQRRVVELEVEVDVLVVCELGEISALAQVLVFTGQEHEDVAVGAAAARLVPTEVTAVAVAAQLMAAGAIDQVGLIDHVEGGDLLAGEHD